MNADHNQQPTIIFVCSCTLWGRPYLQIKRRGRPNNACSSIFVAWRVSCLEGFLQRESQSSGRVEWTYSCAWRTDSLLESIVFPVRFATALLSFALFLRGVTAVRIICSKKVGYIGSFLSWLSACLPVLLRLKYGTKVSRSRRSLL